VRVGGLKLLSHVRRMGLYVAVVVCEGWVVVAVVICVGCGGPVLVALEEFGAVAAVAMRDVRL
jgi:hypothetical protein